MQNELAGSPVVDENAHLFDSDLVQRKNIIGAQRHLVEGRVIHHPEKTN
jgi:hypothetical protein